VKLLVWTIQLLVISAIIYPMFYLWDTNNVEQFCKLLDKGAKKQELMQLADENSVKIIAPVDVGILGKWRASAVAWSPLTSTTCDIVGQGNRVSDAWIKEEE